MVADEFCLERPRPALRSLRTWQIKLEVMKPRAWDLAKGTPKVSMEARDGPRNLDCVFFLPKHRRGIFGHLSVPWSSTSYRRARNKMARVRRSVCAQRPMTRYAQAPRVRPCGTQSFRTSGSCDPRKPAVVKPRCVRSRRIKALLQNDGFQEHLVSRSSKPADEPYGSPWEDSSAANSFIITPTSIYVLHVASLCRGIR